MIILIIPLMFMLVGGLLCMGPAGWIALACGLEFFGWATKPKKRCAPAQSSPANVFILLLIALVIFSVIMATVAHAIDPHFSLE